MPVVFKNPDVADVFEACREADGKVHIPAGKAIPGVPSIGYSGLLSGITRAAAIKAIKSGSNLLKLKEGVTLEQLENVAGKAGQAVAAENNAKAEDGQPGEQD